MRAILPPDDEARLVREFLGDAPGYFVDVGAFHPEQWSQSFHLEERGWTGILVEPQPGLAETLRQRRKAKVVAVACSSPRNAGRTMTLQAAGPHSSLNQSLIVETVRVRGSIAVAVKTLDEVLIEASAPAPVDFMSIDVEGHEIEVLQGTDLARWRPRLLLIEDMVLSLRLHRALVARGYVWVRRTGLNSWYMPAPGSIPVSVVGRLQFLRKYYLAVPFRRLRQALRRLRFRLGLTGDPP